LQSYSTVVVHASSVFDADRQFSSRSVLYTTCTYRSSGRTQRILFFFLMILIRLISLADDRLPSAAPGVIQAVSLGFNPNLTARFLLSQINATHTTVRYGLGKECDPCVRAYITVAARLGYWITLSRPPYIYYVIHSQLADRDHMATYRRHTRENDRCPAPRHVVGTVKRAPLDGARRPADLCVVACDGNTALPAEHSRGGGGGGTGTGRSVGHNTHRSRLAGPMERRCFAVQTRRARWAWLVLALSPSVNSTGHRNSALQPPRGGDAGTRQCAVVVRGATRLAVAATYVVRPWARGRAAGMCRAAATRASGEPCDRRSGPGAGSRESVTDRVVPWINLTPRASP
jgi:hypothetical protein